MKSSRVIIDIDNMHDEINAWKKSIDYFDTDYPSIDKSRSDGFDILRDCGFSNKSFNKFDRIVDTTMFNIKEFYSTVLTYLEDMTASDKEIDSKVPNGKATMTIGTHAVEREMSNGPTLKMDQDLDSLTDSLVKEGVKESSFQENYTGIVDNMLGDFGRDEVKKSALVDNYNVIKTTGINDVLGEDTKEAMYNDNSAVQKAMLGDIVADTEAKESSYVDNTNLDVAHIHNMTSQARDEMATYNNASKVSNKDLMNMNKNTEPGNATFQFNI